jgi:hypothetical protein
MLLLVRTFFFVAVLPPLLPYTLLLLPSLIEIPYYLVAFLFLLPSILLLLSYSMSVSHYLLICLCRINSPSLTSTALHHYNLSITITEAGFRSLQGLVRTIRNARNEYNVEAGRKIGALVRLSSSSPSSAVFAELLETEGTYVLHRRVHCRCRCIVTIRRKPVAITDAT